MFLKFAEECWTMMSEELVMVGAGEEGCLTRGGVSRRGSTQQQAGGQQQGSSKQQGGETTARSTRTSAVDFGGKKQGQARSSGVKSKFDK